MRVLRGSLATILQPHAKGPVSLPAPVGNATPTACYTRFAGVDSICDVIVSSREIGEWYHFDILRGVVQNISLPKGRGKKHSRSN